jgi:hypothetical protein
LRGNRGVPETAAVFLAIQVQSSAEQACRELGVDLDLIDGLSDAELEKGIDAFAQRYTRVDHPASEARTKLELLVKELYVPMLTHLLGKMREQHEASTVLQVMPYLRQIQLAWDEVLALQGNAEARGLPEIDFVFKAGGMVGLLAEAACGTLGFGLHPGLKSLLDDSDADAAEGLQPLVDGVSTAYAEPIKWNAAVVAQAMLVYARVLAEAVTAMVEKIKQLVPAAVSTPADKPRDCWGNQY